MRRRFSSHEKDSGTIHDVDYYYTQKDAFPAENEVDHALPNLGSTTWASDLLTEGVENLRPCKLHTCIIFLGLDMRIFMHLCTPPFHTRVCKLEKCAEHNIF